MYGAGCRVSCGVRHASPAWLCGFSFFVCAASGGDFEPIAVVPFDAGEGEGEGDAEKK